MSFAYNKTGTTDSLIAKAGVDKYSDVIATFCWSVTVFVATVQ